MKKANTKNVLGIKSRLMIKSMALVLLLFGMNVLKTNAQTWTASTDYLVFSGDSPLNTANATVLPGNTIGVTSNAMSGGSGITLQNLSENSPVGTYFVVNNINSNSTANSITNNDFITNTVTVPAGIRKIRLMSTRVTGSTLRGAVNLGLVVIDNTTSIATTVYSNQGLPASLTSTTQTLATPYEMLPGRTYTIRWHLSNATTTNATKSIDNPVLTFQQLICNASTAPTLSTTTTPEICPASSANLNSLITSTTPANTSLVWFTNSAHTGSAYGTPTAATNGTYYAFYFDSANNCFSTASAAVTVTFTNCNSGCNILQNPSFETPTGVLNSNSIQTGTTIPGWTASANTQANPFNIIRVNGTAYSAGPDNADAGSQYLDIVGSAIITQTFTVPAGGAYATYSGSYANRDTQGNPGYTPSYNYITILNSSGTIVGTSNSVDLIQSVGDEKWFNVSGFTATKLPAGVYTYKIVIGDFTHFDNALVCLNAVTTAGTIDCSKTQISPAPVAGIPGQRTLFVTLNVTAVGCFAPISVTGSGMSLPSGISQVCATTTGIQTFSIPVNYDGSALSTMNFTIGSAGSCSADLTQAPKKANCDIWTLECVPTEGPSFK